MAEVGLLLEAANFACVKHRDQRRKDESKTPYINHPIGVAYILWKEGGVTDIQTLQVTKLLPMTSLRWATPILQAAVLHDTVEDTDTTLDEIEEVFGVEVRRIVDEVTDDKSLPKAERKRLQVFKNNTDSNINVITLIGGECTK